MLETDVYGYFAFGYNYHIIRRGSEGGRVHGEGSLEDLLDGFFDHLGTLNLQVTSQAAYDLREIRERLDSLPEDARVDSELAREVNQACEKLDVTLDSELGLRTAFVVMPGRFSVHHLLDDPTELLGSETLPRLPDIAVFDFISACRAIALGLGTAAAFHLMRCIEAMLREYYSNIVKRQRVKQLMWFPMVQHLRKRRDAPPSALLDHLENIRVYFRYPTLHPVARYELQEAQDLLSLSIDALNRMARDLSDRENAT